ncbi:MAG: aldolase/citrate lyase family protein [Solirubrobacteraceae bacterium]
MGHCVMTLWTDDPALAAEADASGIDRIGPDFERLHKAERQQGLGYRLSDHRPERLPAIRAALRNAQLFVRTNPLNVGTSREVERLLAAGVQVLMLPMFTTSDEVARFVDIVAGRARVVLLLEQIAAAERLDEILAVEGIDELHVGLNDLALSIGAPNRFALLATPLMEDVAERVHDAGLPLGLGGLGRLGDTSVPVPPDLVYAQHARLGGSAALIARSFLAPGGDLAAEVRRARERLDHWRACDDAELRAATEALRACTAS